MQLLLWVGVVQTSKFHIFCLFLIKKKIQIFLGNNLGCISQVLNRTNNKWPKLVPMAGYWWFYNGPNSIRGMLFLVPLHPLYIFGVENNMNRDTLHPPNVDHCLIHLLGINFRGVFGKKFWCFLHSWLWPCISHPKQNAKIELNNWKGKTDFFWTHTTKLMTSF
jgi:hypothetical protein